MKYYHQILQYQKLPEMELKKLQEEKLKKLLLHAYKHIPYYRCTLSESGVIKDENVYLENFEKIPILTKSLLKREFENLKSDDIKQRHSYENHSGGSTGEPTKFLQDREYDDWNVANKLAYRNILGHEIGMKEMRLWGSERDFLGDKEDLVMILRNFFFNRKDLNAFRMTKEDMLEYCKEINTWKPKWIEAYVESIYELAKFAEENNIKMYSPIGIVSAAGTLYPEIKNTLNKVFECPVLNRYGSREVGDIACGLDELQESVWNQKVEILKTILKIIVTITGLYLAYRQIDPKLFNINWRDYNFNLFALASVMSILSIFFTSFRLYIILRREIPFSFIVKSDYIGSFFNLFLPSTVGGDIVKISKVSKYSGSFSHSTVSIILDRFFGVLALIILSILSSVIGTVCGIIKLPTYLMYIMAGILALVVFFFVLLLKIDLTKFRKKIIKINIFNFKKTINIEKWIQAIYEIRKIPTRDILLIILVSIIYDLNGAIVTHIILKFLNVNISLFYVILFRSISSILLVLPISISGLGVRDYIYKELYGSVTSSPQVLLLAPIAFLLICLIGIVGGIIFLFDEKFNKKGNPQV